MKRRIDFEREPTPKGVRRNGELQTLAEARITKIIAASSNPKETSDMLIIELKLIGTFPSPIGVALNCKEEADDIISKLIAARNEVWPGF